jgi:restriction system-associated AAA family ATPase
MKLVSVKILGKDFRSLKAYKTYKFETTFREDRLSTKVFAGLNGSGKSNFLELFSDIFYFLEVYNSKTITESEKTDKNFGFELEYYLPKTKDEIKIIFEKEINDVVENYIKTNLSKTNLTRKGFEKKYSNDLEKLKARELKKIYSEILNDNYVHVRIEKQRGQDPEYSLKRYDNPKLNRIISDHRSDILPSKIIAYTSGQNEILSNPYFRLRNHYFKAVTNSKYFDKGDYFPESHRMYFIDNTITSPIFIANLLLGDKKKVTLLKDVLKINDLQSFRITINARLLDEKILSKNKNLAINIQKLILCATSWIEKHVNGETIIVVDFLINSAIKSAFKFHFLTAFNLFDFFYELEIFNLLHHDSDTREKLLNTRRSFNFADEMPRHDPTKLVFRIEKIFVSKIIDESNNIENIHYKTLSDGEHQFNEVMGAVLMMEQDGCLFLMDEPDTHFNPKWRAKMIDMLNKMAAKTYDLDGNVKSVSQQDIIITTHSPFAIADSFNDDVYVFNKNIVGEDHPYTKPKIKTYGASIGSILENIFNRDNSISDLSNSDLDKLRINTTSNIKIYQAKESLLDFGESIEKFDVISYLFEKEEEITKKLKAKKRKK